MESCNQKSVKQIKIYSQIYLRFFKVATLCPDSFSPSWHSLNQLHLECFSNRLEGVPTYSGANKYLVSHQLFKLSHLKMRGL
jgi:hypothetical protein